MKQLAILLGVLLALMLAFAVIFYTGGTLTASSRTITASAAEYPQVFESIRNVLEAGAAPQTFESSPLGSAERYTMMDITVSLSNRGFFPAEWLHLEAEGLPGDVAVYSLSGEGSDLPARSNGTVNLKLITTLPPDEGRTVHVEYHIFGLRRTITVVPEAKGGD